LDEFSTKLAISTMSFHNHRYRLPSGGEKFYLRGEIEDDGMNRTPIELGKARMAPLSRLPAFFALEGTRAIVAGGGHAAAWKAELLSAAGATVDVFAPEPSEDMRLLEATPPAGTVIVHGRAWAPADCAGAAIAVADCADDAEAARFAAAARRAGVLVNVIDRPAYCDFSFGAIVNRSPLVIGISTDGAAPVSGQAVRAKIEALIPGGFAHWANAARAWRPRVAALALPFRSRRSLWEKFTDRAIAAPDATPTDDDFEALLTPNAAETGSVVLVGAGPGDPELLTLRTSVAVVVMIGRLFAKCGQGAACEKAPPMTRGQAEHRGPDFQSAVVAESLARAPLHSNRRPPRGWPSLRSKDATGRERPGELQRCFAKFQGILRAAG
jgi:uroporphyrin-III C-methyltransferase / precorrin-2 dehydrogenase / sirohydrochlorin ferrochelatase